MGRPNLSAMWFDYDGDANRVLGQCGRSTQEDLLDQGPDHRDLMNPAIPTTG